MRTQQEILDRIDFVKDSDFFGFQRSDLIEFLDYDNAKPFLKDGVTKEKWNRDRENLNPKAIMIDYMEFAWDKANNKRGLSAARTMEHYCAWLWLDGNEELSETCMDYEFYGKPHLIKICEYLGLDASKWDDGIRENS